MAEAAESAGRQATKNADVPSARSGGSAKVDGANTAAKKGPDDVGGGCSNGSCGTDAVCFVAGTLVSMAAVAVPIEALAVGDRVQTIQGESATQVDRTWRVVRTTIEDEDVPGHVLHVELLRAPSWLEANGIRQVGDSIYLDLPELGARGWGRVAYLGPVPDVSEGEGRVVLSTVNHVNNDVYELSFAEGGTLRPTGRHPLYSLDRDDWVRVKDLQVGERLQTAEGAVTVEALEKVRGLHRVYNLEVEGDHEYLVGEAGVRAHNSCALTEPGGDFIAESKVQRAAFEKATTKVRKGKRGRIKDVDDAVDQYDSISKTQRKVRRGEAEGLIIESTKKSKSRVRNRLSKIRHIADDGDDLD